MPAYNHTKRDVVEKTKGHVLLDQEGNFYCRLCGGPYGDGYLGGSSLKVQQHFEGQHGYTFGICFPPRDNEAESHMIAEGIRTNRQTTGASVRRVSRGGPKGLR